ncbi:hypothetical protein H8D30_03900 [bacterium]|nr:hypothetical protein [bacterium]
MSGQEWYLLQTRSRAENIVGLTLLQIEGVHSTTLDTEEDPSLLKVMVIDPIPQDLAEELEGVITRVEIPTQQVRKEKQVVKKELYPRYVFVQMNHHPGTSVTLTRALSGMPGVLELSGGWDTPQPLSEEEASVLMKQVGEASEAETIEFAAGDTVRILEGAFIERIGKVMDINTSRRMVRVSIPIFGKETPVEVEVDKVVAV